MNGRKHFLRAIAVGNEPDIASCAMIIAGHFQPGLNIQEELSVIGRLVTQANAYPVVDAHSLVEFLAIEKGFHGNSKNYYSVSNSLLNHVLASKRGIPITLALVYISIVQNQKFDTQSLCAWGINFPGHFLVGLKDSQGEHLADPFKGSLVTKEDCYSTIANLYEHSPNPDDHYFKPADSRQLLRRILENLKSIYLNKGYADNALECLDYQLMLYPEATDLLQQQDGLLKFLRDKGHSGANRLQ